MAYVAAVLGAFSTFETLSIWTFTTGFQLIHSFQRLETPTEAETLVKSPVTCTKPESPRIAIFKPSSPNLADCMAATNQIKYADTYAQGSTVTFKTCSVTYSSADDIDGEKLEEAAKAAIVAIVEAYKTY